MILIFNNLNFTIQAFEIIFDLEYSKFVSDLNAFLQLQPNNFVVLTLLEILAIKFWFKFIQKRVLAINDEFLTFCLTFQNLLLSFVFTYVKICLGDGDILWGRSLQVLQNYPSKLRNQEV